MPEQALVDIKVKATEPPQKTFYRKWPTKKTMGEKPADDLSPLVSNLCQNFVLQTMEDFHLARILKVFSTFDLRNAKRRDLGVTKKVGGLRSAVTGT